MTILRCKDWFSFQYSNDYVYLLFLIMWCLNSLQIKPHRIDRMYYMSGNQVKMSSKYDIDMAELERLKSLSQARQGSQHYGRGLR